MKTAIVAITLLTMASMVGCSDSAALDAALEKAKAEAEAAKAEANVAKAELAPLKAQLAGVGGKPGNSRSQAEAAVKDKAFWFFVDLSQGQFRSAYDTMSVAYKTRTDRKAFDQFIEKHPALRKANTEPEKYKLRKLAKDNAYECDSLTHPGAEFSNMIVRVVQEDGAWKIDDFVEIREIK